MPTDTNPLHPYIESLVHFRNFRRLRMGNALRNSCCTGLSLFGFLAGSFGSYIAKLNIPASIVVTATATGVGYLAETTRRALPATNSDYLRQYGTQIEPRLRQRLEGASFSQLQFTNEEMTRMARDIIHLGLDLSAASYALEKMVLPPAVITKVTELRDQPQQGLALQHRS